MLNIYFAGSTPAHLIHKVIIMATFETNLQKLDSIEDNYNCIIDGKAVHLNKWEQIYWNGTWSNRGHKIYALKQNDEIILLKEAWSKYQGELTNYYLISMDEFKANMLDSEHESRARDALNKIGIIIPAFEK